MELQLLQQRSYSQNFFSDRSQHRDQNEKLANSCELSSVHLRWSNYFSNQTRVTKPFRKLKIFWTKADRKNSNSNKDQDKLKHNGFKRGMVLEPKFTDYGSIHSMGDTQQSNLHQHSSSHALLSPHSIISVPSLDDGEVVPNTSKELIMTQDYIVNVTNMTRIFPRMINTDAGDLYQRQPLLPAPSKVDKWGDQPLAIQEYYVEEEDDEILRKPTSDTNGSIKINMPPPIRKEPTFPQEKWKTVIAAIIMFFCFILTLASLAMVHERVPDRKSYGPLPDIFLDSVPAFDWALDVSEYIIMISVNSCLLSILLHKYRFIVFRRIFLILSLLYMYRAITMYVTVMPVSSTTYYCSPKTNHTTPYLVAKRIITLFSGLGLSVNGKHTYCGDYIYSGHTVTLVISYLFISEYTPKKLYPIHWLYWILGIVGVCMLQLAHGHYTVDVIIAYFVTTRIFWTYHTLANNASLKQHSPNNYLGREWWFCLFLYFEGNVGGPVPRQWPDWPLPWPRRCHSKSRES